jgi:hypothetical protein
VLEFLGADAPRLEAGDLQAIAALMEFFRINYYSRCVVSAAEERKMHDSGYGVTDMGWEIYPRGLTDVLLRRNATIRCRRCTSPRTAAPSRTNWSMAACATSSVPTTSCATSTP